MFEYQPREGKGLNKLEATAMLTGIQVDTKSFTKSAGTRTFDAASYLRSAGADGLMIQSFMKENPETFMMRNHLISRAEINDKIALCTGEEGQVYDPVTAAHAAILIACHVGIGRRRSVVVAAISDVDGPSSCHPLWGAQAWFPARSP